jgi:hypothetical protein
VGLGTFVTSALVAVMIVVHMPVLVLDRLVNMPMGVLNPDEEPRARDHEGGTSRRPEAGDLAQKEPCDRDRNSRSCGEQG